MSDVVHVSTCRLCDSPDLDLIIRFPPTPPGDQYVKEPRIQPCYALDLMVCDACGAVQLADTVDPKLIYTDYIYTTSISPGLDAHFAKYAEDVIKRVQPEAGSLVVDIGSNDGTLLQAFKARGHRVIGVDPAKKIADAADDAGIPTWVGYFTRFMAAHVVGRDGQAAVLTANHVMANVADLHNFVDGVKTLLAPDGTFVFETGYWPAIMQRNLIDTIEHEHIHYFAVATLQKLFARHGLALVHVEEQPTKGGSLRGYVKHAPAEEGLSVALLIAKERSLPSYERWTRMLNDVRCDLLDRVDRMSDDERWVGYGSAVGSTLLLHYFGLGHVLKEIWDDNASRHGMYSPGFHLPVVAPGHSKADRIVLLAWRYADMITAKHPEYAGKWIQPLPSLRFA